MYAAWYSHLHCGPRPGWPLRPMHLSVIPKLQELTEVVFAGGHAETQESPGGESVSRIWMAMPQVTPQAVAIRPPIVALVSTGTKP